MPAKYDDLGKKANDLFSKGYEQGKYKLEVGSKADKFEATTKGHQDAATGKITSSHEIKFGPCPVTKNLMKFTMDPSKSKIDVEMENAQLVKNLKLTLCGAIPLGGCPCPEFGKVKAAWANDKVNFNLNSNLTSGVNVDAVFALNQMNLGTKLGLDAKSMGIRSREVAFNMQKGTIDYTFRSALNGDFNTVVHNQVSKDLSMAISCTYNNSGTSLALAGKKAGACGSSNQYKICNNGVIALSHNTPLKNGSVLTVSGEFDATNLSGGGHKLGAGLKFTL